MHHPPTRDALDPANAEALLLAAHAFAAGLRARCSTHEPLAPMAVLGRVASGRRALERFLDGSSGVEPAVQTLRALSERPEGPTLYGGEWLRSPRYEPAEARAFLRCFAAMLAGIERGAPRREALFAHFDALEYLPFVLAREGPQAVVGALTVEPSHALYALGAAVLRASAPRRTPTPPS